jgi:hypothetical protein
MINNYLAQAAITNPVVTTKATTGLGFFQQLIPNLVTLAFVIGTIIFFFMLIIGAIQWISSGGDKAAVEAARGRITNALIGLILLFSALAVVNLIEAFFHINILSIDITKLFIK